MRSHIHQERGNFWTWLGVIIFFLLVLAGGAWLYISQALGPVPDQLAQQPWIQSIMPKEEIDETEQTTEIPYEESLRNQMLVLKNERDVALARVTTMEKDMAEKDRLIQAREDEIARLQDTINLAQNSNLSDVALIYENMNPQDAADSLTILGAEQASLILGQMRESKAADVMGLMDDQLVVEITRLMAGFNSSRNPSGTSTPEGSAPMSPLPSGQ